LAKNETWLPVSKAVADEAKVTPDLVRFGPEIEPVVKLIEETPKEKCVVVIGERNTTLAKSSRSRQQSPKLAI
jgi:hypothetical protein